MILYHSTNEAGKARIEVEGFGLSHDQNAPDSTWFAASRPEDGFSTAQHKDWWVILELPDEVAQQYHWHFDDGTPYLDNYLVPFEVVNQYRPFMYECWADK